MGSASSGFCMRSLARRLLGMPPWAWFVICGLAMELIFYAAFTRPYNLDEHGHKPRQHLSALTELSTGAAVKYALAFMSLFALYWLGYRMAIRPIMQKLPSPRARMSYAALILTLGVIFNGILLPIYPFDATDVYDYVMHGRMAALYDLNPLQDSPVDAAEDPAYAFTGWRFSPSAYGPAWERIGEATVQVSGETINQDVVAFKLVAVIGYAVTALFIALTLREIAPRRIEAGLFLFAWNPLVIFVTGGNGHNDAVMMAFMMMGVYLMSKRWYAASTGAMMLGVLVKFIPLMGVPMVVLVAFSRLGKRERLRYMVLALGLCALLLVVFYGPYWHGMDTLPSQRRDDYFTGSVATVIRQELGPLLDDAPRDAGALETPKASGLVANGTLGLMAIFYAANLPRIYRARDDQQVIRILTLLMFFYLVVTSVWFQAWYALWLVALAVLLDNRPLRRLALFFSYLVTWEHIMYNFVTLRYDGWADIPWRDGGPVAVHMGGIYLSIAAVWVAHWLRSGTRTPLSAEIGARIQQAREDAGLTVIELADELAMPTDDLQAYERGDLSIPLDVAQQIMWRLSLPFAEVFATDRVEDYFGGDGSAD
jgi:hypothetical protein